MTENAEFGRNLLIISKYFKMFFKKELKEFDLNAAEGMVLLALYGKTGQTDEEILTHIHGYKIGSTQDEIIDELHYDKGAMARTMHSLESKGYVLRGDNPEDNRSYIFTLTEKAYEFKPSLINILRKWNDLLLSNVEHLDEAKAAVREMAENAKLNMRGD